MATFAYVGKTRQGTLRKGEITASSMDQAKEQLLKQNLSVTSLQEKSGTAWYNMEIGGSSITDKDLVVFTRQFATMINAGLPLIQCLDILASQTENKGLFLL